MADNLWEGDVWENIPMSVARSDNSHVEANQSKQSSVSSGDFF